VHFDNLLFILLVLVAMLFRWLASAASKASKDSGERQPRPTSTPPPIRRAPENSDAERIRKFLEALGQPQDSPPPSPAAHRTDVAPRPLAPVEPPREMMAGPLWKRRPVAPKKIQLPGQITTTPYEEKTFRPHTRPAVFEVQESAQPAEPPAPIIAPAAAYAAAARPAVRQDRDKIDIAVLLASPAGLRDAIVLREIFGPPRSLQPLDLVGSA
jgi:hypothetical protein